ncbi:hypothetical protein BC834DRAFT_885948 [Gloeopeniophorella convolvens]|nr:hypothetical protein BC834DRAFT_885948 [Gloeopeniophorella convolvens]
MASKRARPRSPSSPSESPVEGHSQKRAKHEPGILSSHSLFIVHAKLSDVDISEINDLADKAGATIVSLPEEADVIITAIGMRKRLERHLNWDLAKTKALVTPDWLSDSVAKSRPLPCADYAALPALEETTAEHCPRSESPQDGASTKRTPYTSPRTSPAPPSRLGPTPPAFLLSPSEPPPQAKLDHAARFSCARASPLVCVNQALRSRALEGNERSALSYARAIAVRSVSPRSFPREITARERSEVQGLPYIGAKISNMIDEYLFRGHIAEVEETKRSERFTALALFNSIYGIGPVTARNLYARGLRSLRDLEAFYEVDAPEAPVVQQQHEKDDTSTEMDVRVALRLRDDLVQTIPRKEVEAIHATIMRHLDAVEPGCASMLVGGYRRGKPASNDIDVVFTHPDATSAKGLCARLVQRLRGAGLVTHVMHLSGFHEHDALRTAHWDSLEKALTVFRTPGAPHRRVDLICALPQTYWTAVVGWTGSTMFERDLRSAAKAIGLKFDSSGITRRRDSQLIYPRSEKEVFDILGLAWVDPVLRNADA